MVNQNCSDAIENCDTLCSVLHSNREYELQRGMAPKIQLQHTSHLFIYLLIYLCIYLCLHSFIYEVGWVAVVSLGFCWGAFMFRLCWVKLC